MTLERIQELVSKWLVTNDPALVPTILCAVLANRLPGDPLWLMVIGPSSTGKTDVLSILRQLPDIYHLADLTPRTFISAYKSADQPNCSLLMKLTGKTVIYKDFTSVLAMNPEKRSEILAQMREIFDGRYSKDAGNHTDQIAWEGKVGFTAAVTPAIDLYYRTHALLGERFIYLRHDLHTAELREESARYAIATNSAHADLLAEAQAAVAEYMADLPLDNPTLDDTRINDLVALADAVAFGRCAVAREGYSKTIMQPPQAEGPGRVAKQLSILARAHAALHRRKAVTADDMALVQRVAHDCVPPMRFRLLSAFAKQPGSRIKTIAEECKMPVATMREHVEDLRVIELVEEATNDALEQDGYQLSERGWQVYNRLMRMPGKGGKTCRTKSKTRSSAR